MSGISGGVTLAGRKRLGMVNRPAATTITTRAMIAIGRCTR
jgi:hypothetical protein